MKVKTLVMSNFMIFESAEINWSKNINVICGKTVQAKQLC